MGEAIISRRGGGGGLPLFFGDGSDGDLDSSGNVTITTTTNTGLAILQYTSMILNSGHTFTVSNRCRGLVIYCQGDVVVDGTINMSQKAGYSSVQDLFPLPITPRDEAGNPVLQKFLQLATVLKNLKGGVGGNGGSGGRGGSGTYGGDGANGGAGRVCAGGIGGGGGGGATYSAGPTGITGGSAGHVNAFYGGNDQGSNQSQFTGATWLMTGIWGRPGQAGGGGLQAASVSGSPTGFADTPRMCQGAGAGGQGAGYGYSSSGVAYALNPSLSGQLRYSGGFLCIIAKGNVTIGSTGILRANGGDGGVGSNGQSMRSSYGCGGGGGGGGAGGGVIAIFHKGVFTNNGTIEVNGGAGGSGGSGSNGGVAGNPGTGGGIGTIHIQQL